MAWEESGVVSFFLFLFGHGVEWFVLIHFSPWTQQLAHSKPRLPAGKPPYSCRFAPGCQSLFWLLIRDSSKTPTVESLS